MSYDERVRAVLVRWYLAHEAASDNTTELLAARTAEECNQTTKRCAARMRDVERADQEMLELASLPDDQIPPIARLLFQANADKGCPRCWLSSNKSTNHPECNRKIGEWFGCHGALLAYVREAMWRFQPLHEMAREAESAAEKGRTL